MVDEKDLRIKFREYLYNKVQTGKLSKIDANTQYSDADYPRKHAKELGLDYFEMFKTDKDFEQALNLIKLNFEQNGKKQSTFLAYKRALLSFKNFYLEYLKNNVKSSLFKVWFVRSNNGEFIQDFLEKEVIAIGWLQESYAGKSREEIKNCLLKDFPGNKLESIAQWAGCCWRFANEIKINDYVLTNNNDGTIYIGKITGNYKYSPDYYKENPHIRSVNWIKNIKRNSLPQKIQSYLKSNLTVTSFEDFDNDIEKICNSNSIKEQDMPNMPLNQILYGPPGTGKTYNTSKIVKMILSSNKVSINKKSLKEITQDTPWWQAIALSMYQNDKNKKYKVSELEFLLKDYILLKNNKTVKNKIWEQLQKHTDYTSETVFAKDRNEPFIFDKTKDSEWYITERGLNYIEDQLINEEQVNVPIETTDKYTNFVTFHQSYSYEEFVEGIKPFTKDGHINYSIQNGIFKKMCIKANADPENKYVLVIDEINRGNISKIFGELITLIEKDKRVNPNGANDIDDFDLNIDENSKSENSIIVKLPYSQKDFGVPSNLYILGTMNTSDRSIASIDIALRRRFKFVEMMPKPEKIVDENDHPQMVEDINLQSLLKTINERISYLLDRDHQIGHSYFMNWENYNMKKLKNVWFDEIIPLLNEYFYSDWDKLQAILGGKNDNDKNDKKFFITKLKKPDLAYNVDCSDEEFYYNFVKKEDVNETDFRTMLENAKLIEPKSNEINETNEQTEAN